MKTTSTRKKRPCPRGLYDGCPIPRELCTEDYARTGEWHCLELLQEFESFVFPTSAVEEEDRGGDEGAGGVMSMEELMRLLEREAGGR